VVEAHRAGIFGFDAPENAFGPLTLAAVRLPEAEAAPAETLMQFTVRSSQFTGKARSGEDINYELRTANCF
jgi:hypothetical protein